MLLFYFTQLEARQPFTLLGLKARIIGSGVGHQVGLVLELSFGLAIPRAPFALLVITWVAIEDLLLIRFLVATELVTLLLVGPKVIGVIAVASAILLSFVGLFFSKNDHVSPFRIIF